MLKVADVMKSCDCNRETVLSWINKGYLIATKMYPERKRSTYVIDEKDLDAFMASDHYSGHPSDILSSRAFTRTPVLENCYPINLLIAVRQIDIESEESEPTFEIWDYDIRAFKKLINKLNDREQRTIEMRYHYGLTLDETGAALGLTRERIRQIQAKAERKLRFWSIKNPGCLVVTREKYNELFEKHRQLIAEYEHLKIQFEKISGPDVFESAYEPKVDASKVRLEDMDLTVRSYNCLKRAGIDTLKDIIEFDMNQQNVPSNRNWLTIRNLGKKSLMEVAKKVFEYCRYRIQYFSDNKYQGYIPILEGESLVIGNVEYYGGET